MAPEHSAPVLPIANRGQSADREDEEQGGAGGRDQSSDKKAASGCPFPLLDKEALLEYLPSLATSTLLGVTAIFVLTSNQSLSGDNTSKNKGLRQFLLAMPYTLFLFALLGLAAAFAVKRRPHILGCASGTLLAQLICLVLMGGLVTLVRGDVNPAIVWPVTSAIIVILLFVWSMFCAYPKFLWCLSSCCHEKQDIRNSEKKCTSCGGVALKPDGNRTDKGIV